MDDTAKARVGVDKSAGTVADENMVLTGARPDEQNIASFDCAARRRKPRLREVGEVSFDRAIAQAVTSSVARMNSNRLEAHNKQSDAIKSARRVPAVKPERGADMLQRCLGHPRSVVIHRGLA